MERPSFSYGAAYADLDLDGRLDLVVNNIDGPAFIYRNIQPADDAHHYLRVKLVGDSSNTRGVGTTLVGRLLVFDAKSSNWMNLKLPRNAKCMACGLQ